MDCRPAAYCRVSTQMQAQANGIDAQRHAIQRWCEYERVPIEADRWYADLAFSGKNTKRPEWMRLVRDIRAGTVNTVVMYDLSRASRSLADLVEWVREMVERKVRVVFVKDSIDINTAMGRLVLHIMGAIAEHAREESAARVSMGIQAKLRAGEKWGRGRRPKISDEAYEALRRRVEAGESVASVALEAGLSRQWLSKKVGR